MIPEHLIEERKNMVKMAKKNRNDIAYEKRKTDMTQCEICNREISKQYHEAHTKTKRHIELESLHINKKKDDKKDEKALEGKVKCDICLIYVHKRYYKKHLETKIHQSWEAIQTKNKIT